MLILSLITALSFSGSVEAAVVPFTSGMHVFTSTTAVTFSTFYGVGTAPINGMHLQIFTTGNLNTSQCGYVSIGSNSGMNVVTLMGVGRQMVNFGCDASGKPGTDSWVIQDSVTGQDTYNPANFWIQAPVGTMLWYDFKRTGVPATKMASWVAHGPISFGTNYNLTGVVSLEFNVAPGQSSKWEIETNLGAILTVLNPIQYLSHSFTNTQVERFAWSTSSITNTAGGYIQAVPLVSTTDLGPMLSVTIYP